MELYKSQHVRDRGFEARDRVVYSHPDVSGRPTPRVSSVSYDSGKRFGVVYAWCRFMHRCHEQTVAVLRCYESCGSELQPQGFRRVRLSDQYVVVPLQDIWQSECMVYCFHGDEDPPTFYDPVQLAGKDMCVIDTLRAHPSEVEIAEELPDLRR